MKNPRKSSQGQRTKLGVVTTRPLTASLALLPLYILVLAFAHVHLAPWWGSSSPALAQSNRNSPIELTEFDGGILLEWTLSPETTSALNSDDPFAPFVEGNWSIDLLDDILLPAYTISLWETPLAENETAIASDEIVALVDVLASEPVSISVESKTMPSLTGPTGSELPFISPLDPPKSLMPTEPVFILREGIQRGQRRLVIAVSPIFRDERGTQIATKGAATLLGVSTEQGQAKSNQAASTSQDGPDTPAEPGNQPEASNQPESSNLVASEPVQNVDALSSPLDTPDNSLANTPLDSPLMTPAVPITVPATAQVEDTQSTVSSDTTAQQPVTESLSEEPIAEAAQPTPLSVEPPLVASNPTRSPTTPWTGLLTFAFFGLALIYVLVGGQE